MNFSNYFSNMNIFRGDNNSSEYDPNHVNVLNKYLKYKNKYLSLKKLMIKQNINK